jgi:hypothetical protein
MRKLYQRIAFMPVIVFVVSLLLPIWPTHHKKFTGEYTHHQNGLRSDFLPIFVEFDDHSWIWDSLLGDEDIAWGHGYGPIKG